MLLQYTSLDQFMEDVKLLVDNACTFNEENSQIHTVSWQNTFHHACRVYL